MVRKPPRSLSASPGAMLDRMAPSRMRNEDRQNWQNWQKWDGASGVKSNCTATVVLSQSGAPLAAPPRRPRLGGGPGASVGQHQDGGQDEREGPTMHTAFKQHIGAEHGKEGDRCFP
jgi:hypothetical protein